MSERVGDSHLGGEGEITLFVASSFEECVRHRPAWDELVLQTRTDIYQTFDWCRIWWKYYGTKRQLRLFLCFKGDRLVGVVPAFWEDLWLGLTGLRVAKLVGSDYTLNLCNLPVPTEYLPAVLKLVLTQLFQRERCDQIVLGPLSGQSARIEILAQAGVEASGIIGKVWVSGDSCNSYFELPKSFEEYLKSVPKQPRGNYNRSVAQLAKAHDVQFDNVSTGDLRKEFDEFCRLHDAQWKSENKLGHFGDWPHARRFNEEIVDVLGEKGFVRFYRIVADKNVVSSQYCFLFGGTNYWRLPARIFGPEWDRLSFGRMGLIKMIEAAIGEGQTMIEGGRGHYGYKVQLGAQELPLRSVQYSRRGWWVSLRVSLFRITAAALNLLYYKILFIRVAPKIAF